MPGREQHPSLPVPRSPGGMERRCRSRNAEVALEAIKKKKGGGREGENIFFTPPRGKSAGARRWSPVPGARTACAGLGSAEGARERDLRGSGAGGQLGTCRIACGAGAGVSGELVGATELPGDTRPRSASDSALAL